MRPLRLRLRGLRSYREERQVDLSDLGLFAVVGPTGAGKSSLLEAIYYALYGSATFDSREVRSLLADEGGSMEVELEFLAEGRRWRVARAHSARGSSHRLELLGDAGPVRTIDGATAVKDEIERLVGLDAEAFLSVVILPQGRFDALLRATPADRTRILKGLFRLDRLEDVRERARTLRDETRDRLQPLRDARARLPEDPDAHLVAARAEAAAADGVAARAEQRLERAQALRGEAEEARRDASERVRAAASLDPESGGCADVLAAALAAERALAGEAAAEDARRAGLVAARDAARAALAAADAAGVGPATLGAARERLGRVAAALPRLAADRDDLAARVAGLAVEEAGLAAGAAAVTDARLRFEAAAVAAEGAEHAAREAERAHAAAASALAALRAAAAEEDRRAARAAAAAGELAAAEEGLARAESALEAARASAEAAQAGLEDAQRADAAAHAAAGCGPGDPCPVCRRTLPAGFAPPAAEGLAAARAAAAAALAELDRSREQRAAALAGRDAAHRAYDEALAERVAAARAGADRLGELRGIVPDADSGLPDADMLAPLAAGVAARAAAAGEAAAAREDARREHDRLAADREARARLLAERSNDIARDERRVAADARALEQLWAGLPEAVRAAAGTDGEGLAEAGRALESAAAALEAAAGEAAEAEAALEALEGLRRVREERHRDAVEVPRASARRALDRLAGTVGAAAALAGEPPPPGLPDGAGAEAEIACARAMTAAAGELRARLEEGAAAATRITEAAEAAEARLLAEAGCPDHRALAAERDRALGRRYAAAEAAARAERDAPRARALDGRIGPALELEATLGALASTLADGKFVNHVVGVRQRALLETASAILGEMTGGRFGFGPSFAIVDRPAGRERSVKTLSGGESFLASLALALGLVELAARSGGRLDALFLDEGFGALDSAALDEALAELERRAEGGRLVGVISHVPAVAERIDDVLLVTRDPVAGSDVHRLGHAERERMLESEAAGLLAG